MDVSKSKANITAQFSGNLFPIKMIISLNFHFCMNELLNFPSIFWVLTSTPNSARYLQFRLVKQSPLLKIMQMYFFFQNIYDSALIPYFL